MDDLVIEFIETNTTQEMSELLLDIVDICQQIGYLDMMTIISNYIDEVENVGTQQALDNVINFIDNTLNQVFLQFGITVDSESSLVWRKELLIDLLELEDLEDVEQALDILEGPDRPEEKLADLLDYYTGKDSTDYLINILKVSPSVIGRLIEVYTVVRNNKPLADDEMDEATYALLVDKQKKLKEYREYVHDELGPFNRLLSVDIPLLLPFKKYLEMLDGMITEEDTQEEIIRSITVATIICDSTDDMLTILKSHMEDLADEPLESIKVEAMVRKHITEFQIHTNKFRSFQ